MKQNWIWLPAETYPHVQTCPVGAMQDGAVMNFAVAEFEKEYRVDSPAERMTLFFSGDTAFQLYLNDVPVATGPAVVGGDFIGNDRARGQHYAYRVDLAPCTDTLRFLARVMLSPVQICEYSMGRGGFMLTCQGTLADGTAVSFDADESWRCRLNGAYTAPCCYEGEKDTHPWMNAQCVPDIWHATAAPIPPRQEHAIVPQGGVMTLLPGEQRHLALELDRIYAGFVGAQADGKVHIDLRLSELTEKGTQEHITLRGGDGYRGFYMHSAGMMHAHVRNLSDKAVHLSLSFIAAHYPTPVETPVRTSREDLNQVLSTCMHTLKYCRQTHHLDSPRHCEPMACTGDYYVETLMTLFSFGDMRLSAFDLMRTARMLEREQGRMFHTTYSLIWVLLLRDVYLFTGDDALLLDCRRALGLLLARFETYVGANGLIETPPDYMFIDWIYLDGHSLHHPPKALGQSCLNMYYFAALDAAERVYIWLNDAHQAARCREKRQALRNAIMNHLFDRDARCFCMGLNTPTPENLLGAYMPQNTDRRYLLKHANILAAAFGVAEDTLCRELVHRIMADDIRGEYQPWFAHWLMAAVERLGLKAQYTIPLAEKWIMPVQQCPKGLVEGFVKPEPAYVFDHSHAWGGTPLYSLPSALLGLKILSPGMAHICLSPALLGLEHWHVTLHTPFGPVQCSMSVEHGFRFDAPAGVQVVFA